MSELLSQQESAAIHDRRGIFARGNPLAWKPGQSGNPGGRPKGASFAGALARHALAPVSDRFGRDENPNTLAFDDAGNLFVGIVSGGVDDRIYRYDGGKAENRRLLADDLFAWSTFMALTVAPDQRKLYLVDYFAVTTIDVDDGTDRVLYEFPREPLTTGGAGIAVYIPPGRGDVNCDGSLDLADVEPFIVALLDAEKYKQKYPDCDIKRADITLDGSVDLLDVEPFITLLLN